MKELEFEEQCSVIDWAEEKKEFYPELWGLNSSANGMKRHIAIAVKLKKSGVKSGYPDLFLPSARHGFHGLYIELKIKGGRMQPNQKDWQNFLRGEGYMCVMCVGAAAAIQTICDYLEIDNA